MRMCAACSQNDKEIQYAIATYNMVRISAAPTHGIGCTRASAEAAMMVSCAAVRGPAV
jgi:hypothetical protein